MVFLNGKFLAVEDAKVSVRVDHRKMIAPLRRDRDCGSRSRKRLRSRRARSLEPERNSRVHRTTSYTPSPR